MNPQFDSAEQSLFEEAWSLIAVNGWVTLQNLSVFLVALDKILIESPPKTARTHQSKSRFGVLTSDGDFIVSHDSELNQVCKHFALFSKNK